MGAITMRHRVAHAVRRGVPALPVVASVPSDGDVVP